MHYEEYIPDDRKPADTTSPLLRLMDIVDGSTPTTAHWFGTIWRDNSYHYNPDQTTVENCEPLKLSCEIFQDSLKNPHGIVFGNQLRRLPAVNAATWAILFRWHRRNRAEYTLKFVRPDKPQGKYTAEQYSDYSSILLYSYDHQEDLEQLPLDSIDDWSDITSIDWPDHDS